MGRKPKATKAQGSAGRVDLSAEETYGLDLLAARWTYERKRPISRKAVVSELIAPALKGLVLSMRTGPIGKEDSAA